MGQCSGVGLEIDLKKIPIRQETIEICEFFDLNPYKLLSGGSLLLAAADGTVTIANAIDSWGGGYGYHIKISHNDTFDTLYAHCSSICVTVGQKVKQGEVIGYVGTTGNSTGNHLHFEVWQNGERTDALGYFKAKE